MYHERGVTLEYFVLDTCLCEETHQQNGSFGNTVGGSETCVCTVLGTYTNRMHVKYNLLKGNCS